MATATPAQPQPQAQAGLRGVVVGDTTVSYVDGERGHLIYRGIDIHDLAQHSTFDEVAYLLWYKALPTKAHLDEFRRDLAQRRALPEPLLRILREIPRDATPMDVLRTAVSALALFDPHAKEITPESNLEKSRTLKAVFPTILAAYYRLAKGEQPILPRQDLDSAANFLYMLSGKEPDANAARLLDVACDT